MRFEICNGLSGQMPDFESGPKPLFTYAPLFDEEPVRYCQDAYGLGPPLQDHISVRKRLAHQYIRGSGMEFGALQWPLDVPLQAEVRYADTKTVAELRRQFPHLPIITAPDIITDLESMKGVDDESEDFVIANQVVEHLEDPFKALKSMNRVLRPNGIAYITLPDKTLSVDKRRNITPLDHLIRDHQEGPDWSLAGHYEEWCRCIMGLTGEAQASKVALFLTERVNIHFHVWDYSAMKEMFDYLTNLPEIRLEIILSMRNGLEVIWILRKSL
jgi:SAM-dependent methyltransferase